jgi:hypothetical protein
VAKVVEEKMTQECKKQLGAEWGKQLKEKTRGLVTGELKVVKERLESSISDQVGVQVVILERKASEHEKRVRQLLQGETLELKNELRAVRVQQMNQSGRQEGMQLQIDQLVHEVQRLKAQRPQQMESRQHKDANEQEEQEMMVDEETAGEGVEQEEALQHLQDCGCSELDEGDLREELATLQEIQHGGTGRVHQLGAAAEGAEGGSDSETSI